MLLSIFCILHVYFFASANAAGAGLRFKTGNNFPYAEYETWDFSINGTMSFLFQTDKRKALLLYQDNRRNDRGQDYMDVFLDEGHIRLRFSFGFCKQTSVLRLNGFYSDSKWHYIVITLDFKYVSISVDKSSVTKSVKCRSPEYINEFSIMRKRRWAAMYLGGIAITRKLAHKYWSSATILYDAQVARFEGCIGNLMYQKGNQKAVKAKLKRKEHVVADCTNACKDDLKSLPKCQNGGTCIDHIVTFDCDCTGTGYEGDYCANESSMVYMNGSGYIAYRMLTPKLEWSMKGNRLSFRFVPLHPNGVILYLGNPTDHLVVEMLEGTIRVAINLGGGSLVMRSNVTLNVSEYHYVEITRRQRKMTLDLNKGWYVKNDVTPGALFSLDLKDEERVAYFGGGPGALQHQERAGVCTEVCIQNQPITVYLSGRKALHLSASKRNFSGFLQELKFEKLKVLDRVMYYPKDKRFTVVGDVLDGKLRTTLLPSTGSMQGSGCGELDDDEDMDRCSQPTIRCFTPECIFRRFSTDSSPLSTTEPTTMTLPVRLTYGTPSAIVMSQRENPPDHRVSPWIIIIIVAAAVIAVIITIFLLYRWNNRYTGSFKPSKGELTGEGAQPAQRAYEQPAFYVSPNKPTKGETIA